MRRTLLLFAALFALAAPLVAAAHPSTELRVPLQGEPSGRARATVEGQQAAPAASLAADLLAAWNREAKKLIDMAEDFPEDKYNYKPTPEVRSFAEQLQHVAEANARFTRLARGEAPGGPELHEAAPKTKAEIVALLRKSFEEGAAAIGQAGEAGLSQPIKLPTRTLSAYGLWTAAVVNAAEHYGNLVVYYRLNGLVPPTTRAAQERERQQAPPR